MSSVDIVLSQKCYDIIKELVEKQRLGTNEEELKVNLQALIEEKTLKAKTDAYLK
jgi:hypothetical protein